MKGKIITQINNKILTILFFTIFSVTMVTRTITRIDIPVVVVVVVASVVVVVVGASVVVVVVAADSK